MGGGKGGRGGLSTMPLSQAHFVCFSARVFECRHGPCLSQQFTDAAHTELRPTLITSLISFRGTAQRAEFLLPFVSLFRRRVQSHYVPCVPRCVYKESVIETRLQTTEALINLDGKRQEYSNQRDGISRTSAVGASPRSNLPLCSLHPATPVLVKTTEWALPG